MKNMKNLSMRSLALLLALTMCLCMPNLTVFAEENDGEVIIESGDVQIEEPAATAADENSELDVQNSKLFNVATADKFEEAMTAINNAEGTDGEFIISLTGDISFTGNVSDSNKRRVTSGKTVRILGNGHTIYVSSKNALSTIGADNATLELGAEDGSNVLIITAGSDNTQSLVSIKDGTLNMYGGVQLKDNTASSTGGSGVQVNGGTFNMYGGEIKNNKCNQSGGGVYVEPNSTFNMYDGEIKNNEVKYSAGGGVCVKNGTFNMYGGIISGNKAGSQSNGGGGVYNEGEFTMSGGEISGNTATTYGGGVYNQTNKFEMTGGTISGNTAFSGGGVYTASVFNMTNSTISDNNATFSGGGVYNGGEFTVSSGEISGNTATNGSGVYNAKNTTFKMTDSTISDNNATSSGGGVYTASVFNMYDSTISGNTASSGGGVFVGGSATLNMSGSTISGNESLGANSYGGGIYNNGIVNMVDATLSGNAAGFVGGGIANLGSFEMIGSNLCDNTATDAADDIFHYYRNDASSITLPADTSWQLDSPEAREDGAEEVFYTGSGIQDEDGFVFLKANHQPASEIAVVFSPVPEESNQYYIILKSLKQGKMINGYMACDLAFKNEITDHVIYDIEAAENMNVTLASESEISKEYHFEMKGKPISSVTGEAIMIGIVTFNGYGTFKFNIDTDYESTHSINIVNTTKIADHIVDYYTVESGTIVVNDKLLMGDNIADNEYATIIGELKPPTKTLTVNVTFPNSVSDNAAAYQKMQLVISGGDIKPEDADKHIFDLGNDNTSVAWDDTAKTYTITDLLTEDIVYTVTVSGEGYRTARYTVLMAGDKTLTFWNNVMDNAVEIETGKPTSAREITFLAGDIVRDNNINIYDLSAVVSYFGTQNLAKEHPEYAKYDLNRDGVIDSKDVAYVLVSWGR